MVDVCSIGTEYAKKDSYALTPVCSGEERCAAGHSWGAGVRAIYMIHYVISGEGTFCCGPNKFALQPGQMFVIYPGTIIKYQADAKNPWHYAWVGFYGDEAKEIFSEVGISVQKPIFSMKNGSEALALLRSMPAEREAELKQNLMFTANLYAFMSLLTENASANKHSENAYLTTAVKYIKAHYNEDITVGNLASQIGIGRKYLFAIFKRALNLSPKEYVICYRIERAKVFLQDEQLSVGNIAYSVGYRDALAFSKIFKARTGLSPTEYRKSHAGNQ